MASTPLPYRAVLPVTLSKLHKSWGISGAIRAFPPKQAPKGRHCTHTARQIRAFFGRLHRIPPTEWSFILSDNTTYRLETPIFDFG